MDDLNIIDLYFARNEQALTETDNKYGKLCFRLADNILKNREDSCECVNDTYLCAWNKIPPARPDNLMSYICKITRNLSLKKLEMRNARKRTATDIIPLSELEEILPDKCIAPDVKDEELGELISTFLKHEKRDARNVFVRKYWFFDSVSDIAEQYSFSESKVKSILFHTRNRLREYLRKGGIIL